MASIVPLGGWLICVLVFFGDSLCGAFSRAMALLITEIAVAKEDSRIRAVWSRVTICLLAVAEYAAEGVLTPAVRS